MLRSSMMQKKEEELKNKIAELKTKQAERIVAAAGSGAPRGRRRRKISQQ